jgi:hypothetical protein
MRICLLVIAGVSLCWVGCNETGDEEPRVSSLDVTAIPRTNKFNVKANVTGPTDGLQYRFYTDDGSCTPQLTPGGASTCIAAPGAAEIKIRVELLRGNQQFPGKATTARVAAVAPIVEPEPRESTPPPRVTPHNSEIEITTIPPYSPTGGPDTRADIAGLVRGVDTNRYKLALYTHTDYWYVQPLLGSIIDIDSEGNWKAWTHTGSEYAALLVRNGYVPPPQLYQRPQAGGEVLSVAIVPGKR